MKRKNNNGKKKKLRNVIGIPLGVSEVLRNCRPLLFIVHQLCAACTGAAVWEELCSLYQTPPVFTGEEGNLQREAEG